MLRQEGNKVTAFIGIFLNGVLFAIVDEAA
jgi:hypothetical protein